MLTVNEQRELLDQYNALKDDFERLALDLECALERSMKRKYEIEELNRQNKILHAAIECLQQQNEQYEKQIHNLKLAWEEERDKANSYREIANVVNNMESASEVHNRKYWAWMPYEENYLESLSCPVLIPADWLRQLLDEKEQKIRQLIGALRLIEHDGDLELISLREAVCVALNTLQKIQGEVE